MIEVKATENLTGISIMGDYNDFSELVDCIYRMTCDDEIYDNYYGVKNRLLALCYDIRHASMGDRDILLVDNGTSDDMLNYHNIKASKDNVYYSVNIYFPEAIFLACATPKYYHKASLYYGNEYVDYSYYLKDKAYLNHLWALIWNALANVIGEDELKKLIKLYERTDEFYLDYVTEYIDKCNIELFNTPVSKRKDKIRNITRRIIKKPQTYYNLEIEMNMAAEKYNVSIYDLTNPTLEYPEEIIW